MLLLLRRDPSCNSSFHSSNALYCNLQTTAASNQPPGAVSPAQKDRTAWTWNKLYFILTAAHGTRCFLKLHNFVSASATTHIQGQKNQQLKSLMWHPQQFQPHTRLTFHSTTVFPGERSGILLLRTLCRLDHPTAARQAAAPHIGIYILSSLFKHAIYLLKRSDPGLILD